MGLCRLHAKLRLEAGLAAGHADFKVCTPLSGQAVIGLCRAESKSMFSAGDGSSVVLCIHEDSILGAI